MGIEELKARLLALSNQTQAIQDKAAAGGRELSNEEHQEIVVLADEFDRVESQLATLERTAQMQARVGGGQGRRTDPQGTPEPQNAGGRPRQADGLQNTTLRTQSERDRWGFANLGEFARSVVDWQRGTRDPRIVQNAALSTYSSEGIGADGGVAVPPEFRANIQRLVTGEDALLSRCDAQPTNSTMVIVPTDEDTVWGSSGGVRVYRRAEAGTMTQSKLALKDITVRIEELYALVPVTDGLLADAPLLASFLSEKAGQKMNFKITDEVINGTGSQGQMLGILNAPCVVSVAKEGSQAANTIVAANILKMFSRMPDAVRRNAVWLINQDIEPQLLTMNVAFNNAAGSAGIAAGVSTMMPEGGMRYDPTNGTLMGRPIIATEACSTLGTVGDIILAWLPGYFAPYAAGGVRSDMSMHLWFDQGVSAFRWTFRIGGQPWLSAPISRKNGSNTLSHFVTLATRG
jgi:HK97 family phage major capsid protein